MDLLFKRYASPFILLESYIANNSFSEFVIEFIKNINEEENDKKLWDLYMFSFSFQEKSFSDFKKAFEKPKIEKINKHDLEATIKDSFKILSEFNPS